MSRIAVIGDIGGHLTQLREALWALGVDDTLPDDLVVIQVGDLVHKGPDSDGVVALVDGFLQRQPDRWIQLLGNHEACHLGGSLFWHDPISAESEATIRRWQEQGRLRLGVALTCQTGPTLITHAGLTFGLWTEVGRPDTPAAAVQALEQHPELAYRPGSMLGDTEGSGGVLWAEAGRELYQSWLHAEQQGRSGPFGQVHGHSSAWRWAQHRSGAPDSVAARLLLDEQSRHVRSTFADVPFIGIDPGFGQHADGRWAPLILEGSLD